MPLVDDTPAHSSPTHPGPAVEGPKEPTPPRKSDRPSARPPGAARSLVGQTLSGRYRVVRLLGEGAMGAVYEAEHVHMRKRMAVKVLHAEMTRRPDIVERFEREAMAAGNIDHPNVAAASDFGKLDDGAFFLVLEFVVGQNLREALSDPARTTAGRFELGRALHVTRQIASAVGRAHALNIVHRDLKPENVMLVDRGGDPDFVKVLDFGIAKVPIGELPGDGRESGSGAALTRAGMVFGTPDYMAPEQALGQPVDARADLYAIGVLAFEMLTGMRPFEHENAATLLMMHISSPAPTMASVSLDANVPPAVEAIVARLLAKDPADRFAGADDLIAALSVTMAELVVQGRIDPARLDRTGASGALSLRGVDAAVARLSVATSATRLAVPAPHLTLQRKLERFILGFQPAAERALGLIQRSAGTPRGRLMIAGSAALVLALVVTAFSLVFGPSKTDVASPVPVASSSGAPPQSHDSAFEAALASAEGAIDRGDFASAVTQLTPLERDRPDSAAVHHDLERARMGAGDVRAAFVEARAWLASDVGAGRDPKFEQDVARAAVGTLDPDDAFDLLEGRMGTVGADILYDIAFVSGHPPASERAKTALAGANVRRNASPALGVALDLRNARTCEAKRALLERAREVGDARALAVLLPLKSASGCGFLGRRDCAPCLHRDSALADAVTALEARAAKP